MRGDVDHKGRVLLQGVIVTRYMSNRDFEETAFPVLAREIFETVKAGRTLD